MSGAGRLSRLYEIVIRGRVGQTVIAALDGFELVAIEDGYTRLQGWVTDQSALYGVLQQISGFGLELASVKSFDSAP